MDTLRNEVTDEVRETIREVILNKTYREYTPTEYNRTGELANIDNIKITYFDKNSVVIEMDYKDGGKDVAKIVATGIGYTWQHSNIAKWQLARNFYEDAYEELVRTKKHVDVFIEGMKRRGIKVFKD